MNNVLNDLREQSMVERYWDSAAFRWVERHVNLEKFADLVEKNARKHLLKDVINLLEIQHEAAAGRHNYWKAISVLIESEFGVRE